MHEKSSQNLLLDSLSSDSDVPDLELIPPNKTKRKTRLKRSSLSKLSKLSLGNNSAQSPDSHREVVLPRSWLICLCIVLLSLITGLIVLAWFTVNLSSAFEKARLDSAQLQEAHAPSSSNSDLSSKVNDIQKQLFALETKFQNALQIFTTNLTKLRSDMEQQSKLGPSQGTLLNLTKQVTNPHSAETQLMDTTTNLEDSLKGDFNGTEGDKEHTLRNKNLESNPRRDRR